MIELKVYHCNEWHNEYTEFYIKSEADKVIADLEESHKKEVGQLLMEIVGLKARIAELEEERRWRKFPDEKPEEWDTVVVRFSNGFYDLAVYLSNGQGWDIGDGLYHKSEEVSHWMPLPSAPKEKA